MEIAVFLRPEQHVSLERELKYDGRLAEDGSDGGKTDWTAR
jgi:hypothetical protein